jgi:tetratricopeptide (TPR) repeat protein
MRLLSGLLLWTAASGASPDIIRQAADLYHHAEYEKSLHLLANDPAPGAANFFLGGKNTFMQGDYQKAIEYFEKAIALAPANSEYELWLGRAWGRRAENSNWMTAAPRALKARQCFEKAVALVRFLSQCTWTYGRWNRQSRRHRQEHRQ